MRTLRGLEIFKSAETVLGALKCNETLPDNCSEKNFRIIVLQNRPFLGTSNIKDKLPNQMFLK